MFLLHDIPSVTKPPISHPLSLLSPSTLNFPISLFSPSSQFTFEFLHEQFVRDPPNTLLSDKVQFVSLSLVRLLLEMLQFVTFELEKLQDVKLQFVTTRSWPVQADNRQLMTLAPVVRLQPERVWFMKVPWELELVKGPVEFEEKMLYDCEMGLGLAGFEARIVKELEEGEELKVGTALPLDLVAPKALLLIPSLCVMVIPALLLTFTCS